MCLFVLRSAGGICTALERAVVSCCRDLEVALGACAADIGQACKYCATNSGDVLLSLLLFLFNVIACPLAACIGLLSHVCIALIKWIPGSWEREVRAWDKYCLVLHNATADPSDIRYAIDAQGRRVIQGQPAEPVEPSIFKPVTDGVSNCFSCCLAEVYCCCFPCFGLYAFLLPIILLVELLANAIVATINAAAAGAVAHPRDWWPQLSRELRAYDVRSSVICFADAQRFVLCDCECVGAPPVVQGAALV